VIGSAFHPTRLWQLVNEEARCEVLNRPSFGRADIAVKRRRGFLFYFRRGHWLGSKANEHEGKA